ncbi:MAG: 3-deoxy-7-phosphoheptulonate synthase [Planctomycetota bacterium]|nr:MAG: 3-deoxy-7-phosphoheptulonate synthase [Planctomycetota bacterium]
MIVVMREGCKKEEVDRVVELVREMNLKDHVIVGTERTVVAVIGDDRYKDRSVLESCPGVDRVVPILAPYKIASRQTHPESTVISLRQGTDAAVGGRKICVIAGPCSVEDRKKYLEIAQVVKELGATALRGGAFKPRTDPYQFQGLGEEGLEILAEAREQTGLPVVTEVMSLEQVLLVAKYADVLQIGTRNMHNFNLLQAVGKTDKPILLKRGWSAKLDEFLLAAEYVIQSGNPNVVLCERGIRTHEEYVRNTLPLAIIPAVKRESHLPIIIDPAHGTGHAYMVPAMCRAAVAAGADGVMVEVHQDPEHALTDGAQSLTPQAFETMMKEMKAVAEAVGREVSGTAVSVK